VAGAAAISLGAALPAGATASSTTSPANNIIVGSGSSTTYSMMQGLDTLFNSANTCPLTSDNTTSSGSAQPLDFSCVTGPGADALALNAPQNENPWADVAVEEPPIGSSNGIKQLEIGYGGAHSSTWNDGTTTHYLNVANNINFARSSRDPSNSSSTGTDYAGLNFVAYATDGVSWVHYLTLPGGPTTTTTYTNGTQVSQTNTGTATIPSASAAVQSLSTAQITAIWTGTDATWGAVGLCADGKWADGVTLANCTNDGGPSNLPILVFSAQEGSGTQSTWKGAVGSDPTQTSSGGITNVNCVSGTNFVATGGACNGPIVIFENELADMTAGSMTSSQATNIDPVLSAHASSGTATDTKVNGYTGALEKKAKATTSIVVTGNTLTGGGGNTAGANSLSKLANGDVLSISGVTGTVTVSGTPVITPANTKKDKPEYATVTLATAVTAASGATVSWSHTSSPTRTVTTSSLDDAARSLGIFFYSYGKWKFQAGQAGNASYDATTSVNCATGCGGQVLTGGYSAALGQIGGVDPTDASVLNKSFPVRRYLYNVYSNGSNPNIAPAATPATLNYISEAGFICKPQNTTIVDPATGQPYINSIQSIITSNGFLPLSAGAASGVVNQTPIADEVGSNTVNTLAAQMNLKSGSHDYSTVMNVPASSSYSGNTNTNAGTSLSGGYVDKNGAGSYSNPSGFCLVNSTDNSHAGQ
jgi:hypothetical protein